jgi:predicted  nucleic acid-binding Zn-ribbon protein
MNPDLERLIQLQAADQQIARLNAEIAALPKRVAAIESKLADTKAQVEKSKQAIAATQSDRRRLEGEIRGQQEKISKYRDQSLSVKTNEQYKALLQEIQFAEAEIRNCEDKILEGMIAVESQDKDLKAAEADLKSETAEIEKEKAEARARTAEDESQLAEWAGKRDSLRAAISADALRYYDRVAKLRGTGISEAREQICGTCYVMLRPQTYNEVRTNEQIIACDSCGRILYYDPSHEPEAAAPQSRRRTEEAAGTETPAAQ